MISTFALTLLTLTATTRASLMTPGRFISDMIQHFSLETTVFRSGEPQYGRTRYTASDSVWYGEIGCGDKLKRSHEKTGLFVSPECRLSCREMEVDWRTIWFLLGGGGVGPPVDTEAIRDCRLRLDAMVFSVEFDAENRTAVVWEFYGVNGRADVIARPLFKWEAGEEIEYYQHHLVWERRIDLHGVTLINALMDFAPLVRVWNSSGQDITHVDGFFMEMIEVLGKELNFRFVSLCLGVYT